MLAKNQETVSIFVFFSTFSLSSLVFVLSRSVDCSYCADTTVNQNFDQDSPPSSRIIFCKVCSYVQKNVTPPAGTFSPA